MTSFTNYETAELELVGMRILLLGIMSNIFLVNFLLDLGLENLLNFHHSLIL